MLKAFFYHRFLKNATNLLAISFQKLKLILMDIQVIQKKLWFDFKYIQRETYKHFT